MSPMTLLSASFTKAIKRAAADVADRLLLGCAGPEELRDTVPDVLNRPVAHPTRSFLCCDPWGPGASTVAETFSGRAQRAIWWAILGSNL
jgi:hypothetical protein